MHDLFSEVKQSAKLYRILRFVERKIFSSASAILVTNEKFKQHYLKKGILNVIVLHSCVDLNRDERRMITSNVPPRRPGKLRIVFTGGIYAANEDAILCFLKAVEKLKDVEVVFATTCQKEYLKNVNIGFVPKKVCYELQKSADILLLPLAFKSPYPEEIRCAFPTKALEYLAANKPILAIVPKGTFCQEFIEKNHIGIVVTEPSEQKIVEAIEKFRDPTKLMAFHQNSINKAFLYDARTQAKKLYTIIRKVASNY
jgi:glycosyltransferase involved in cell wall biosynthesis